MWGGRWRRAGRCSSTGRWSPAAAGMSWRRGWRRWRRASRRPGVVTGRRPGGGPGGWRSCSPGRGRSGPGWAAGCRGVPGVRGGVRPRRAGCWSRCWASPVARGGAGPGRDAARLGGSDGVRAGGAVRGEGGAGRGCWRRAGSARMRWRGIRWVRSRRRTWPGCCRWRTRRAGGGAGAADAGAAGRRGDGRDRGAARRRWPAALAGVGGGGDRGGERPGVGGGLRATRARWRQVAAVVRGPRGAGAAAAGRPRVPLAR